MQTMKTTRLKTVWASVPEEIYDWIHRIHTSRRDASISATIRYLLTMLKELIETGDQALVDELRRWMA